MRELVAPRPLQPVIAAVAAVGIGVVAGVVGLGGVERLGTTYVILPAAAAIGWWLVTRPTAAVIAMLAVPFLLEDDRAGFLPQTAEWYRAVIGPITPTDSLIGVALGAVILDHYRRSQPFRVPIPFVLPQVVLLAAIVAGMATGLTAGADLVLLVNSVRILSYLLVVPFVVAHVMTSTERVRKAVLLVGVLGIIKAAIGMVGVGLGRGRHVGAEGGGDAGAVLTFYGPVPNLVTMLVALAVIALVVRRLPTTRVMQLGAVLCTLSLAFSYRRSFWIAFVVAAALVVIIASGQRSRVFVLVGIAAIVGGLYVMLNASDTATNDSVIAERVRSIDREEIEANAFDRYRLEEQKNVLDEISRRPLTGIGLGRPWEARHPLSIENEGGRNYTHTTVLWYWLKLGPLGPIAYAALHAVAIALGYRLWRRARDPLTRAAGLALAAGLVGLALAETTGSFTGVEERVTMFVACAYGWLAAASALVSSGADALEERVGS